MPTRALRGSMEGRGIENWRLISWPDLISFSLIPLSLFPHSMLYSSCKHVSLLILALYIVCGVSATAVANPRALQPRHEDDAPTSDMPASDSHSHSHLWEPLVEFNDPEDASAPSYWAHDFKSGSSEESSSQNWRGLMGLHVIGMSFAFFVLLPVGKRSGCSVLVV